MTHFRLFLLVSLLLTFCKPAHSQNTVKEETQTVSERYLELDSGLRYDDLGDLYSETTSFFDPTGEVFQGPVSQGVIRGGSVVLALQRSWGLSAVKFEPKVSFYVGEYALHRGTYHTQIQNSESWYDIPFVTVHRVKGGKVEERTDFGEYVESFSLGDGFDANTMSSRDVADRYLKAYLDADLELQAELMAADVNFQDPTSRVFGPQSGQLFENAEQLLARRGQMYENITEFDFLIEDRFTANHHSVYMGTVTYTVASGLSFAQPAVFVIEVREGKVTRHWDFVDYSIGPN